MPRGTRLDRQLRDPEYRRIYQQEKLILDVTELISEAMAHRGVSRAELARRLGRTRGYVTQVLSGSRNLTLRTWADLMTALGCEAAVNMEPLAKVEHTHYEWSASPESTGALLEEIGLYGVAAEPEPEQRGYPPIFAA